VSTVVDANWAAATHPNAPGEVFNIGCGTRTSLNQLVGEMGRILGTAPEPRYEPGRQGDVRHSLADIGKARKVMGYVPAVSLTEGLVKVLDWYARKTGV
jgi:nucleoside-diphosphate-sugar epimerase